MTKWLIYGTESPKPRVQALEFQRLYSGFCDLRAIYKPPSKTQTPESAIHKQSSPSPAAATVSEGLLESYKSRGSRKTTKYAACGQDKTGQDKTGQDKTGQGQPKAASPPPQPPIS